MKDKQKILSKLSTRQDAAHKKSFKPKKSLRNEIRT